MAFLFDLIEFVVNVLTLAIIARSIMSWFAPRPTNIVSIVLYRVTEPILSPLRRIIPRIGMFDFTPMAAIILLQLIAYFLP